MLTAQSQAQPSKPALLPWQQAALQTARLATTENGAPLISWRSRDVRRGKQGGWEQAAGALAQAQAATGEENTRFLQSSYFVRLPASGS